MTKKKYHRCPICFKISEDNEDLRDINSDGSSNGYKCPNGCERSFEQPPYQSPMIDEN